MFVADSDTEAEKGSSRANVYPSIHPSGRLRAIFVLGESKRRSWLDRSDAGRCIVGHAVNTKMRWNVRSESTRALHDVERSSSNHT